MFVFYATTISATAYQADEAGVDTSRGAQVQQRPQTQRAAPFNPTATKPSVKGNVPVPAAEIAEPVKTAAPPAPLPLPGEPGVVSSTHPAADEANQALPPAPNKTTAPRQVDSSGSPVPGDRFDPADQPSTMTDTPVTPPAPEGRDQLDSPAMPPAGSEGKVVAPAPNRTATPPKSEPRMLPPPETPAPPPSPGLDMTRSPWDNGPNDVR